MTPNHDTMHVTFISLCDSVSLKQGGHHEYAMTSFLCTHIFIWDDLGEALKQGWPRLFKH